MLLVSPFYSFLLKLSCCSKFCCYRYYKLTGCANRLWAQDGYRNEDCRYCLLNVEGSVSYGSSTRRTTEEEAEADRRSKFLARRDRALATIVLGMDLYVIGDPVVVWTKLQNQFQKKTWANKLALRRRLHSLQLKDGAPVQDHIKSMTELFNELAIEEDRVVYLLASLPNTLMFPRWRLLPNGCCIPRGSRKTN